LRAYTEEKQVAHLDAAEADRALKSVQTREARDDGLGGSVVHGVRTALGGAGSARACGVVASDLDGRNGDSGEGREDGNAKEL
jgi:hypothetical protein